MSGNRLSKRATEWANTCGIGKFQLQAAFNEVTLQAAQVVANEIDRVINEVKAKSLTGYTSQIEDAGTEQHQLKSGGLTYNLKKYRVYVINNYHAGFSPSLNVFDLIDSGRKALPPKLKGDKPYMLWSYVPGFSRIPVKSVRSLKTGRFTYKGQYTPTPGARESTPRRPEPRKPPHGRYSISKRQQKVLFNMGPLKAVAPRNLYQRIFKNADKALRKAGLPSDMITMGPRKK